MARKPRSRKGLRRPTSEKRPRTTSEQGPPEPEEQPDEQSEDETDCPHHPDPPLERPRDTTMKW